MQLPIRFKLIQVSGHTYVFRMEFVPVTNVLEFKLSIHTFNAPLTQSIVDSFQANESNVNYFKMLPLQQQWSIKLTQQKAEQGLLTLQNVYNSYQNDRYAIANQKLIPIDLPGVKLHLYYFQLYSIGNFWYECVNNWTYWTVEFFKNVQNPVQQQHNQLTSPVIEFKAEEVEEEVEITDDIDVDLSNIENDISVIVNDCLKLSPNNITMYFLGKYIEHFITTGYYEKEFDIQNNSGTISITMAPLLDVQLIGISKAHYMNLLSIFSSFKNLTQDEVYYKLKTLVKEMRFILNIYLQNPEENKEFVILPLKVIELMIFIFGIYHYQLSFPFQIPDNTPDPIKFHNLMITIVNYYIKNVLDSMDNSHYDFTTVYVTHPSSVTFENDISNLEDLDNILKKERYLLDIDKQGFIDNVYAKLKDKSKKKDVKMNLLLSEPKTLDITKFIDKGSTESSWMNYKTYQPPKNSNNTIITQEYYHLIQIAMTETNIAFIQKDLNPIISHYIEIILNKIFNKINSDLDKTKAISTLNLLTNYIRPFIKDASVHTEMTILYKCVIPYLYDMFNISDFVDYFH